MLYSVSFCIVSCTVAFSYIFCFQDVVLFLYLFCSFLLIICRFVWVSNGWLKMPGQTDHFFGFAALLANKQQTRTNPEIL